MALRLLREILRAHRKLPGELRRLGDRYVMKEFQDHRKTTDAATLRKFEAGWTEYLVQLRAQTAAQQPHGAELEPGLVDKMTDEQRLKLIDLRFSTTEPIER